jgi:hypothetical protein
VPGSTGVFSRSRIRSKRSSRTVTGTGTRTRTRTRTRTVALYYHYYAQGAHEGKSRRAADFTRGAGNREQAAAAT